MERSCFPVLTITQQYRSGKLYYFPGARGWKHERHYLTGSSDEIKRGAQVRGPWPPVLLLCQICAKSREYFGSYYSVIIILNWG